VGCQSVPAPSLSVPAAGDRSTLAVADMGSVEIAIHWPQRIQSIPYSSNTLVINAYNSLGRLAGTLTLNRTSDPTSLSVGTMRLKAGTYTIEASAYRETSPLPTSIPNAYTSAGGVTITTNLKTKLSLTLAAQAPTAGAMTANVGGPGSQFTLNAVRFFNKAATSSDTVEVWFGYDAVNRVPATFSWIPRWTTGPFTGNRSFTDPDLDKLLVTVPSGVTGQATVYVRVDNVEANAGPFTVVDRMTINPTVVTRQVGTVYNAAALLAPFSLNLGTALPPFPVLTWTSSNPAVAFVTTQGLVYAYSAGQTTITAQTGGVQTQFSMVVTDRQSSASVVVNAPVLNAGTVTSPLTIPAYSGLATASSN